MNICEFETAAARTDVDHRSRHTGAYAHAAEAEVHPDTGKETNGTPKPESHDALFRRPDQAAAAAELEGWGISGTLGWFRRRLLLLQVLSDQIAARPDDVSGDDITNAILSDLSHH